MRAPVVVLASLLSIVGTVPASAQNVSYPPLSEYMMEQDAEIALARSAAPEHISSRATVKVLRESGLEVVHEGDNGFVCLVLRGWSAPTFTPADVRRIVYDSSLRAPICYDPYAARTVLPLQELRTSLALDGKDPDAIAHEVATAYAQGKLPNTDGVAFGYMLSADQYLGAEAGAYRPHMMIYAPFYTNELLGNNEPDGSLPFIIDDEGTPFTIVVIPLDAGAAVDAISHQHR